MKFILRFFDKLEDKVRGWFSHYPIFYAIIGGIGTVLMWRGIWHTADFFSARFFHSPDGVIGTIDGPFLWDGFLSLAIGSITLLITGLFVATFIGDHVIISGIKHEKKITEKTEEEVVEEENIIRKVHEELHTISSRLDNIEKQIPKRKTVKLVRQTTRETVSS